MLSSRCKNKARLPELESAITHERSTYLPKKRGGPNWQATKDGSQGESDKIRKNQSYFWSGKAYSDQIYLPVAKMTLIFSDFV